MPRAKAAHGISELLAKAYKRTGKRLGSFFEPSHDITKFMLTGSGAHVTYPAAIGAGVGGALYSRSKQDAQVAGTYPYETEQRKYQRLRDSAMLGGGTAGGIGGLAAGLRLGPRSGLIGGALGAVLGSGLGKAYARGRSIDRLSDAEAMRNPPVINF